MKSSAFWKLRYKSYKNPIYAPNVSFFIMLNWMFIDILESLEHRLHFELTKYSSYLKLTGKPWDVYCVYKG